MRQKIQELYDEQEKKLLRFFQAKTGDSQVAMDLLQDLFESVLKNLDSFSQVEDQIAWLFTAARNKVTDWYRKKSRNKNVSLSGRDDLEDFLEEFLEDQGPGLEDHFLREEMMNALFEGIDSLPENLKKVLVAQSLEGRTFRELSAEWEIPQGTLLSRKREALRLLREMLSDFMDVYYEIIGGL
jgi:RNA polymerase sigma factor (sigma-70 family)